MPEPPDRSTFARLRPQSAADVSDAVRAAVAAGEGVYPEGGGTFAAVGGGPLKPGKVLDLRDLSAVEEYPARDMTITAQAGVTVAALQAELAKEGQRLPVDVPHPDRATVGGILAANVSGPRRFGCGTLRDYLIGVRFVTDGGEEVKGGGRVVKNVAGYDLMKLQIGAMGTLGVLTAATLKVTPIPEDQAIVAFGVLASAVGPTLDRLHQSATRPVAVELLNAAAAGPDLAECGAWVVAVGYEEKRTAVDWQVRTLRDELKAAPVRNLREWRGPACAPVWGWLTGRVDPSAARFSLKAAVPPSKLAGFVTALEGAAREYQFHAHAGNGVVHLGFEGDEAGRAERFAALARESGGWCVDPRRRPGHTPETRLMRTVKRTLDPNNVFNPGRLFGDL